MRPHALTGLRLAGEGPGEGGEREDGERERRFLTGSWGVHSMAPRTPYVFSGGASGSQVFPGRDTLDNSDCPYESRVAKKIG